ncbi:MAG: NAD(P)/FAD-dependent oxidoreductase [Ilumatobacter sp.]|uniref:flavin-containing monooxygenase n=1 Tax=Ilumatobacter sp. TaxID=1967498 RepID=UPI00262599E6|nr:NAD(P)/FAD-dependent oxidoreductase [Ilumatobacter sp.]MDJ0767789.1 NAD(P)/FAD-dependent oxidoreductase [Ilumatobacter sp.]
MKPTHDPLDRTELAAALDDADLRVLLMCLVHVTGDRRWLADPYRPRRDVRLIADERAGIPDSVADEIRSAALDALAGGPFGTAIDDPGDELMLEMMRWCMGEDIDAGYAPMMREDLGMTARDVEWHDGSAPPIDRHVVVIGAGASGLIVGARLHRLGVPFTIVERAGDVGGTWRDNTYPGCGVDTPNHAYSYSTGTRYRWSRNFSPQAELLDYLRGCADEFGVRDRIRFESTVTGATWNERDHSWHVRVSTPAGEEQILGTDLVVAIGQFGIPSIPDLPGAADFGGSMFHTTAWPDDLDVSGKRVAIVGTGASAMQIVPVIAGDVEHLTIFQRSPQWARPIPRYHDPISDGAQWLLANVPHYAQWFRFTMLWRYGDGLLPYLRKDPDWPHPDRSLNRVNERHRQEMVAHIEAELGDRTDLLDACVPSYPPYGKRILLDNGWYRTLRRPNVDLVTDPIERLSETGIVTGDGRSHDVDVVVLSTGFRMTDMARAIHPVGRGGITLDDVWGDDDATAHLGITVPGFPNLFLMQGPSTGLGHGGSAIFQAESQTRFITDAIVHMIEGGIAAIEPRRDVHDEFVRDVDERHAGMIWSHPGMSTYYRNSHGRVVSVTPYSLLEYWRMTHDIDLDEYLITPIDHLAST